MIIDGRKKLFRFLRTNVKSPTPGRGTYPRKPSSCTLCPLWFLGFMMPLVTTTAFVVDTVNVWKQTLKVKNQANEHLLCLCSFVRLWSRCVSTVENDRDVIFLYVPLWHLWAHGQHQWGKNIYLYISWSLWNWYAFLLIFFNQIWSLMQGRLTSSLLFPPSACLFHFLQ